MRSLFRIRHAYVAIAPALAILLSTAAVNAQVNIGTISGVATDPNDAVVPGVAVELEDEQTGIKRTAETNATGYYIFPLVPSGVYTLAAETQGFKRYEQTGIQLEVNRNLTVPIQLELGVVTETVTVTSVVPQVDTVASSVKDVVDRTRITELPLNGRNVLQFQQMVNGAIFVGSGDQGGNTPSFHVNGGVRFANNYTLDGGEHVNSFFNSAITFPNPDALQEFSIQTSSYSAEYGRSRGATVNAVTRSGTNELHGSLFEFLRNDVLDARDFFAVEKPPFKRNQFGATVGGPIARNKAFFFFAWESTRERGSPSSINFQSLSPAMRQGDFSELGKDIIDRDTGNPFPNAMIPERNQSPPALNFLRVHTPLPNQPNRIFNSPRSGSFDRDQYIGRYDQELSASDRLFVRYLYNKDESAINRGTFPTWFNFQSFKRQALTLNETHTFSPTLINSLSLTYNRAPQELDLEPTFDWRDLGANVPATVPNQKGWVVVALPGYFTANNALPWQVIANTYNLANTTTWIKNNHTIKFGTQITRYQTKQLFEFLSAGQSVFSGQFTGDPAADFVTGQIASFRQDSPGANDLSQHLWGFFVSDDFRVHPRLTLNMGLRFEPYFGFREIRGQSSAFRAGQQSTTWPSAPLGFLLEGDAGVHDNFFGDDWNNLAPRFGFAWDPFGNQKIAVRGAYGIFYDSIAGIRLNRFVLNQPFLLDVQVLDRPLEDPFLGQSPFPFSPPTNPDERANFQFVTPANIAGANENMVAPYTQQWNLTIETQLPKAFVLSTAYVGSKSSKLFGSRNINPALPAPGATTGNAQQRRRFPQFTFIEDEHTAGYSQYHSFQLSLKRRFASGLSVQSAYTLSKNTGYTGSQGEGSRGPRDPFNWALDDGILQFDATHVWNTSYVWQLPSPVKEGPGRHILGGWEISGILHVQSGFPFTVRSGSDGSKNGQLQDTADLVGDPSLTSGSRGEKIQHWFNTDAFTFSTEGTVGNVGINTMRGPGQWTFDMGFFKNIRVGERLQIQFRNEFFNLFNNANLTDPVATVTSGAFGRIFTTRNLLDPRVMEFGLKIQF